jgi:Protein of unknown function (DUF998)
VTTAAERPRPGDLALPWAGSVEAKASDTLPRVAAWAVLAAASMPIVLTIGWLVADALQPPAYSPMRQTVSVLSGYAGTDRWIVTAALYAVGLGYLITAAGMRDVAGATRTGLVIAACTAFGVATFPVPAHGTSRMHAACTAIGAVAIAVWPAVAARQESVRTAVGARLTAAAIIVSGALFLWTALETRHGALLGLAERVSSALQVSWPFVVAAMLRRARLRASRHADVSGGQTAR